MERLTIFKRTRRSAAVRGALAALIAHAPDFSVHWWGPVPGHRTLFFKNRIQDFFVRAATGTVAAAPGTPMAKMFGWHDLRRIKSVVVTVPSP